MAVVNGRPAHCGFPLRYHRRATMTSPDCRSRSFQITVGRTASMTCMRSRPGWPEGQARSPAAPCRRAGSPIVDCQPHLFSRSSGALMWRWTASFLRGSRWPIDRLAGRTPRRGLRALPAQKTTHRPPRLRPRCISLPRGFPPARSAACIRPSAVNASSTGTSENGPASADRGRRSAQERGIQRLSRNTASTSWRKMTAVPGVHDDIGVGKPRVEPAGPAPAAPPRSWFREDA